MTEELPIVKQLRWAGTHLEHIDVCENAADLIETLVETLMEVRIGMTDGGDKAMMIDAAVALAMKA